jgi:AraC-like DNA-binding protein
MNFERTEIECRPSAPERGGAPEIDPQRETLIVPCGVKKAMTFIETNLGGPIRIADLCAAANLSPRTLFKQFSDFVGMSPMGWLRRRRLQRIRAELEAATGDSVTTAALRWGLTHLGRFAGEYLREFGELPSQTLRRARRRSITSV